MSELLNKAFTLLKLLKPNDGCTEWGAAELARISGLNNATTHRILQSMKEHGFVDQNPHTKKFYLGATLMELGLLSKELFSSVYDLVRPEMESLAKETKEGIHFHILKDKKEAILVERIESIHQLRVTEKLGLRLPLHVGAVRKVILAHLKQKEQEEYILNCNWESRTPNTTSRENELRANLKTIREQGYAISFGETTLGTVGIAVPIFDVNGVIGSLAIVLPDVRVDEKVIPKYIEALFYRSQRINMKLKGETVI